MIPELLAPAGNLEKLKVAVTYGADAVYLGGRHFSLRAGAGNFDEKEMAEGIRFAHQKGARVYVTVNIFARNSDLVDLREYIHRIYSAGVDGIIVSDPGIVAYVRQMHPELAVHLSTQANTTNWAAALFWKKLGVSRIVLARELSLDEIREIRERVELDLEVFVHGAMCIAYSGRCLLSSYLAGRDANLGDCAQSCRWRYRLVEEKRPGEYLALEEDDRGSYILGSRDLCLIEHIPELVRAGVHSFKIEGRMKSAHYVATVVKTYREALNAYREDPDNYRPDPAWLDEISKVSHREYTKGFLFGDPGPSGQHYAGEIYRRSHSFTGIIRGYDGASGMALVEQRNHFALGDEVEILVPAGKNFKQKIELLYDQAGCPVNSAPHPRQMLRLHLEKPAPPYSMLRKKV